MTELHRNHLIEVDPLHFFAVKDVWRIEWSATGKPFAAKSINGHPGDMYWWMFNQLPPGSCLSKSFPSWCYCVYVGDKDGEPLLGSDLVKDSSEAIIEAYIAWKSSTMKPESAERREVGA